MVPNNCCRVIFKNENYLKLILRKIFSFLFVLLFTINIYPQRDEIQFSHITVEDGLSLNVVNKVFQDSRGFMWFGTYNGLNRFDGYSFKVFLPEPSNPNSISNHTVLAISEDNEGNLWIGTNDGLNKYDYKTEKFTVYKNNKDDSTSISGNNIYDIHEDKTGTLWIGTSGGLCKYNKKENNFSVIKKVDRESIETPLNTVFSIYEDNQGNLWLGVLDGLSCLQKDGKILKYNLPGLFNKYTDSYYWVKAVTGDKNKNLWIGTSGNGLLKYNMVTKSTKLFKLKRNNPNSISSNNINSLYVDRLNNVWIGTTNGLNRFDQSKQKFTTFQNDLFKPLSINNNNILSICEDKTGLIWVGTFGGVSNFYQTLNEFYYYKVDKNNFERGLSSSNINCAFVDKNNNVYIGTDNGLDIVQSKTGSFTHFRNEPGNKNSLNNNDVKSVLVDRDDNIWMGTNGGGLNKYNPATGKFSHFFSSASNTNSLSNNGVISLCEDVNSNLWIGTWWGLNYFDKKKEKVTQYISDPGNSNSIRNNLIWTIYKDNENFIWVGTDGGGASCFNPKSNTFKTFIHDSSNTNSISSNKVVSIYETENGILWFGTSNGLSSYNKKTGKFKNYNIEDGLPSLAVNSVIEDKDGFLWISTDKGLSKFNRKNNQFSNFSKRSGLRDFDFLNDVASISSNNILYFGGKYSVVYFDPDSIHAEQPNADITFTDLKIFNQSVPVSTDGSTLLKESISYSKSLSIPYYDDVITLDFALLDYYNIKAHSFKYKLDGFDDKWNNIGAHNSATYTNLPPGAYTLFVKAQNNNDKGTEKEASIKIIIIPSFYQTIWFKILSILALVFLIVLIFKLRINSIKKRSTALAGLLKEKETLLSEKTNLLGEKEVLLKEVHHRVKNNLQVISSLLYLSSKKVKDKEALNMFKDSQSRVKSIAMIHERLYRSEDLSRIDFKEYVQQLTRDLFKSYAANTSVIKLEININSVFVNIDFAVPCGLIINELISNSLKYAFPNYEEENKTGKIKVDFNKDGANKLILQIGDNGVGMPEGLMERKKLSLGLQLVDTLVAQLSGTLEVIQNSGTEFKIIFGNNLK